MADSPSFTIDLEVESEQVYIPGDWNTIDTYTQNYSFNWGETFSSRLDVDLSFDLQFEDILRSLDVDEKTIEPSLDISLKSLVWDLNLIAQDTIDYTNEFNTPRKDLIEFGVDLNLIPFFLPTFKIESQRTLDIQDNLEDKVEEKLDVNIDYALSDILDVSLLWKNEITDDRFFDDSDIDSHDWEFTLDYGQTMTSALKVDFKTIWSGNREDTLNNAGQILTTDREHEIDNNLKFTLDTFPNFDSELELGYLSDFVEDGVETSIDFTVAYDQPIVELGTLTETVTITHERVDLNTEDTTDLDVDFDIELAGVPDKYLDYSIKYTLSLSDHEDGIDPNSNSDEQEDEFNLSVTLTPNEKITIENSFDWSASRVNGSKSDSAKNIKVDGTFEGEMLNVPNLIFSPLLEISKEKDFVSGEDTNILNLELEFDYAFVLPPRASWELSSTYSWKDDKELQRELEFSSDFQIEFVHPSWDTRFEEASTITIGYDTKEPAVWEHDLTFTVGKYLSPVLRFETMYTYEYDGDDSNSDEMEADMEWNYRSTFLSVSYSQERVFENPKDVTRTYTAELSIEF